VSAAGRSRLSAPALPIFATLAVIDTLVAVRLHARDPRDRRQRRAKLIGVRTDDLSRQETTDEKAAPG
jgi:hypothetical protein